MAGPSVDTNASSPAEISRRGWRDVLQRSCQAMSAQKMSLAAAGIAFYMVWAFLPALAIILIAVAFLLGPPPVLAWLSSLRLDLPDSFNTVVTVPVEPAAHAAAPILA